MGTCRVRCHMLLPGEASASAAWVAPNDSCWWPCRSRERPRDWPTPAGLLNWVDEGEANRIMTYALSGSRLTWNVAVPWAAEELEQLGSRRYVSLEGDAGDAQQDPQAKLDRCGKGCAIMTPWWGV